MATPPAAQRFGSLREGDEGERADCDTEECTCCELSTRKQYIVHLSSRQEIKIKSGILLLFFLLCCFYQGLLEFAR